MNNKSGIISVRFKTEEELNEFKKYLKKRKISSFANFIRESKELYEKIESPVDTLNREIRDIRKGLKIIEKKVDVSTEATRSILTLLVNFVESYSLNNDLPFDDEMSDKIEKDIIKKVQNGLSWSEKVLSPMGLKKK